MMFRVQCIALYTLLYQQLRRVFKIWGQTLLPPVLSALLYLLVFGKVIGTQISAVQGFSYVDFIAPGLIMGAVINSAYGHVSFAVFIAKFQRSIDEILVAPMSNTVILISFLVGGILRGLVTAGLVWLITICFIHMPIAHKLLSFCIVVLAAMLLSLAGFINAVFARNFDEISWVPTFVLLPLTYLGGVFYSIHALPKFWKDLTVLNPIFFLVNAFRYAFLGVSDVPIQDSFGFVIVFTTFMYGLCWWLLRKGIGLRQ